MKNLLRSARLIVWGAPPPAPFGPAATGRQSRMPAQQPAIDQRIMKALSHPLRVRMLTLLNQKVSSPSELAEELDEPLGNVSYHALPGRPQHGQAGAHGAPARRGRALLGGARAATHQRRRLGTAPRRVETLAVRLHVESDRA